MENTRIIYFGTTEFAAAILKTMKEMNMNVVATVSQPDRPVGRKRRIEATPVHACSEEYGIECLQPEKLSDMKDVIASFSPDLIVTCAYGQFIPSSILSLPSLGCVNVHPSLLPKYRGGAPIQHAVMNGDEKTGVCLMEMTAKMDAGRIYACYPCEIGEDETYSQLNERLMTISCDMIRNELPRYINGELEGIPQDDSKVVLGLNITREEECVSFEKEDIHTIYNHIRGLNAVPGAYGILEGKRMKFYDVRKEVTEVSEQPGTVLGFDKKSMLVACKGGILHVLTLQPEGKKQMDANAFKNGSGAAAAGKVFA